MPLMGKSIGTPFNSIPASCELSGAGAVPESGGINNLFGLFSLFGCSFALLAYGAQDIYI